MSSPEEVLTVAYDYLGGRRPFADLYDAALTFEKREARADSLAARLADLVLLAEGEEAAGAYARDETRMRIAELLREEAIASLRKA